MLRLLGSEGGTAMDMSQIYLQRLDVLVDVIGGVKEDQLGDPTPCADFDVRTLINHVLGDTMALALAAQGTQTSLPEQMAIDHIAEADGDLTAAATRVREAAVAGWSRPDIAEGTLPLGEGMPGKLAQRIALIEAVLHGWDLATATNQPYEIPEQLAAPMLEGLKKAIGDERPPGGAFGPPVSVPDDASMADKLIAYTGRTP